MNPDLSKRYQELSEELKELFRDLATLQVENERLSQENRRLREEVSMLRLYVDTYLQSGDAVPDLRELSMSSGSEQGVSEEALEFYNSLPQSFNFSELFELADLLGVDKHQMKGYMTIYLRENMMRQHGTRVEKIGEGGNGRKHSLSHSD